MVQSNASTLFRGLKYSLGKYVVLPCQIGGLRNVIMRENIYNYILVDFFCLGVLIQDVVEFIEDFLHVGDLNI